MPHLTISAVPGHSEEEKIRLAEQLVEVTAAEFHLPPEQVSVSMREIPKRDWREYIGHLPTEEFIVIPTYLYKK